MGSSFAVRSVVVAVTALLLVAPVAPAHAATYAAEPAVTGVPNGRVYAIATDATRVYIGGTFTRVRDPLTGRLVARERLAAFDLLTGQLDLTWNPGADGSVRALRVENGVVYAGGSFASAGGAAATRVAALDTVAGQPVPGFASSASGEVRDLAVVDDDLYLAGSFTSVNGKVRVGVAKVDAQSGVLDMAFNARVGAGRVVALAEDPDRDQLLIGGNFKKLGNVEHWFLGAVDYATGARNASWIPQRVCDTCNILDLDADGVDVFAATAGGGGGRAVAYKTTGNTRLWIKQGDGDVQAVDYHDGLVYIGGHFGVDLDGFVRNQVAELNPVTGAVQDFAIPFTGSNDPGVWAISADEIALRIGGGFQGIAGSSAARYAVLPVVAGSDTP